MENPSDVRVASVLRSANRIAMVGLSSNPERPSYNVARYLMEHGYEVIPVNPNENEVLGALAFARLRDVPGHIDIVNVFRRNTALVGHAKDAIAAGAGTLWMQLGVASDEAAKLAIDAGLTVVQDRCIFVEHSRLVLHGARSA
ncbi:MAG: CoA-binding protein [Chloroflexi bacterium]|nr:CoA-binding protein [Chloroflexota bacterium]